MFSAITTFGNIFNKNNSCLPLACRCCDWRKLWPTKICHNSSLHHGKQLCTSVLPLKITSPCVSFWRCRLIANSMAVCCLRTFTNSIWPVKEPQKLLKISRFRPIGHILASYCLNLQCDLIHYVCWRLQSSFYYKLIFFSNLMAHWFTDILQNAASSDTAEACESPVVVTMVLVHVLTWVKPGSL